MLQTRMSSYIIRALWCTDGLSNFDVLTLILQCSLAHCTQLSSRTLILNYRHRLFPFANPIPCYQFVCKYTTY